MYSMYASFMYTLAVTFNDIVTYGGLIGLQSCFVSMGAKIREVSAFLSLIVSFLLQYPSI